MNNVDLKNGLINHFWIADLLVLALAAYFVAGGIGTLLEEKLLEEFPVSSSLEDDNRTRSPRPMFEPASVADGDIVLKRNIFDSVTGPITPSDEQTTTDDIPEGLPMDELPIIPCAEAGDVTAELVATVAAPDAPDWSFATVSTGKKETTMCRVGDAVGSRIVSAVTWRYLLLRGDSDACYLDLFAQEEKGKKKGKRDRKTNLKESLKDGIKVIGPNERVVSRSVVDQALANPTKFAKSVRVRPYKKNGKTTGFRLRRVKRNSPLSLLGAKRGDVIHAVNDVPLTSMDKALAAYQKMRGEDKLVFSVTRKGKPIELVIHID